MPFTFVRRGEGTSRYDKGGLAVARRASLEKQAAREKAIGGGGARPGSQPRRRHREPSFPPNSPVRRAEARPDDFEAIESSLLSPVLPARDVDAFSDGSAPPTLELASAQGERLSARVLETLQTECTAGPAEGSGEPPPPPPRAPSGTRPAEVRGGGCGGGGGGGSSSREHGHGYCGESCGESCGDVDVGDGESGDSPGGLHAQAGSDSDGFAEFSMSPRGRLPSPSRLRPLRRETAEMERRSS